MDGQMGWMDRQTDARMEGGRLWPRLAQKYTLNKHLSRESQEAGRKRGKGSEVGAPSMLGECSYAAANVATGRNLSEVPWVLAMLYLFF